MAILQLTKANLWYRYTSYSALVCISTNAGCIKSWWLKFLLPQVVCTVARSPARLIDETRPSSEYMFACCEAAGNGVGRYAIRMEFQAYLRVLISVHTMRIFDEKVTEENVRIYGLWEQMLIVSRVYNLYEDTVGKQR